MKLFTTSQIAGLDQYTIVNEPIAAIDLMERASLKLADWIEEHFNNTHRIAVFAGQGNNGGDALVVARLLAAKNYSTAVFIPETGKKFSDSFLVNLDRLKSHPEITAISWGSDEPFPELIEYELIVDGLFGSGLTRPLTGFPADVVKKMNRSGIPIIAIDIPSGLMGEDNTANDPETIVQAAHTLTFQFPKLSFFFRENEQFTGKWEVLPIGLHASGIEATETPFHFSDLNTMVSLLKPRGKFSHKGTFGHALLIAGSYGKMGAAVLAARGCLRSGVGLLTVHIPRSGNQIMQVAVSEAIVSNDEFDNMISDIPELTNYKAVGIGPGIGKADVTASALGVLLTNYHAPLVMDADAINLLAEHPEMMELLTEGSVLTPHPVEFERLSGKAKNDFERLNRARTFAKKEKVIIVLKGAYTAIVLPDGACWFNSTGNPGMATAGSGDVLTGIITGLLAQGYPSSEAAILGVYLHGLSGDQSVSDSDLSEESLLAGDIADQLGRAFNFLKKEPGFGKAKKKSQF